MIEERPCKKISCFSSTIQTMCPTDNSLRTTVPLSRIDYLNQFLTSNSVSLGLFMTSNNAVTLTVPSIPPLTLCVSTETD